MVVEDSAPCCCSSGSSVCSVCSSPHTLALERPLAALTRLLPAPTCAAEPRPSVTNMSDSKATSTSTKPRHAKPTATTASTPSSASEQKTALPAAASTASPSSGEAEYPSTRIGSYLSWGYNFEEESKKNPGYICGGQSALTQHPPLTTQHMRGRGVGWTRFRCSS